MIKDFWEEYSRDKTVLSAVWEIGPVEEPRLAQNTLTGDWFLVSQLQEALDIGLFDFVETCGRSPQGM